MDNKSVIKTNIIRVKLAD